jgi:hypothetical protein
MAINAAVIAIHIIKWFLNRLSLSIGQGGTCGAGDEGTEACCRGSAQHLTP